MKLIDFVLLGIIIAACIVAIKAATKRKGKCSCGCEGCGNTACKKRA